MYFLKALYREANPMAIALGLALLYFLFNGIFGSKSVADVELPSKNAVTAPIKAVKDKVAVAAMDSAAPSQELIEPTDNAAAEIVATEAITEDVAIEAAIVESSTKADETEESAVEVVTNTTETHESTSEPGSEATVISAGEQVAESVDANEADSPSIFSRIFKRSEEETAVISTPEAAAAATVIAAAPVIEAVSGEQDSSAEEIEIRAADVAEAKPQVALVEPVETKSEAEDAVVVEAGEIVQQKEVVAQQEVVEQEQPKKSGGFLGLFGGKKDKDTEPEVVAEDSSEVVIEPDAEVVAEDDNVEVVEAESAVVAATETESEVAVQDNKKIEQEMEPAASVVSEQTDSVPPPPAPVKVVAADMQKLTDARRAFWNREYAQADTLYNELISAESSNADLLSEYGNMLLQSGQVEKTLDAYEQAATLMIEGDRKQDAKPLIDYISSWDQGRADQLINKVFAQ